MAEVKTLLDDDREIGEIHLAGEVYVIGEKVDSIYSYGENGELALVPWFAICKDGVILERLPASSVLKVIYK